MVGGVHPGLDREEALRIAEVGLEVDGHLLQRLQQSGERAGVGAHEGIARIGDVELDGAIVGVDRRLDGVAQIVAHSRHARGLGIRIAIGRRVGVNQPHQAARGRHHDVGVGVEAEEGSDLLEALPDRAVHHKSAVRGQVIR